MSKVIFALLGVIGVLAECVAAGDVTNADLMAALVCVSIGGGSHGDA